MSCRIAADAVGNLSFAGNCELAVQAFSEALQLASKARASALFGADKRQMLCM